MAALFVLLVVGYLVYRALGGYQSLQRSTWKEFASSAGLQFLGSRLPEGFPADGRGLPRFRRVQQCVYGERFGEDVIVFRYWKLWGMKIGATGLLAGPSRWDTVVGVRQKHPEASRVSTMKGYVFVRAEGWLLARGGMFSYTPTPNEVLDAWALMRTTTGGEAVEESAAVVIRPYRPGNQV